MYGDHRDLHGLTHSFPTRRSSDLKRPQRIRVAPIRAGSATMRKMIQLVSAAALLIGISTPASAAVTICLGGGCSAQPGSNVLVNAGVPGPTVSGTLNRSEEHTSELQSLMRISYAVFCLKKKKTRDRQDRSSKLN